MLEIRQRFTLKTKAGSTRLFVLFLSVVLLSSFIAAIFSTDGFTVKVEHVTIDARGAAMNGELYYPGKTSSKDKLPAIVVAHGGGTEYGVLRGLSEELARRGFVVLNMSAYGSGLSEQPLYDEANQGIDAFNQMATPSGYVDALNFLRGMSFVDATRIGLTGHSMGSRRTAITAKIDCGYLTYNDIMINVLADTFGQKFTKDEINTDALVLAKQRLSSEQLTYYNYLAKEKFDYYNTRAKAVLTIGGNGGAIKLQDTATVAGNKVSRSVQINFGFDNGAFDAGYGNTPTTPAVQQFFYTGKAAIQTDFWYAADDITASSKQIGSFSDTSIYSNSAFKTALNNRTLRMVTLNQEIHTHNYFSNDTNADACTFFMETLGYNRGELTASSTKPLASTNQIWGYRAAFNCLAMLSMLAMLFPLASLLMKSKFFETCVSEAPVRKEKFSKKKYWLFSAAVVVVAFISIWYCCKTDGPISKLFGTFALPTDKFWSLYANGWSSTQLLTYLATGGVIMLVIQSIIGKKKYGETGLRQLNVGLKFKTIIKALLLACILLAAGYLSLMVIEYLFNQDFRLWQTMFAEMRPAQWGVLPRYALVYLPLFLILSMAINRTVRDDIPEWRDTLNTVVINSIGIWLCFIVNVIYLNMQGSAGKWQFFACFNTYMYTLLFVPITVYIMRKMYKLTNSIWLGAFLCCFIGAWSNISTVGMNWIYTGSTFGQIFFGH